MTEKGTSLSVTVDEVVDGDTVRVFLPGQDKSESVRILALDTEEVRPGEKPVTKLGAVATARAQELMPAGSVITLTLPGDEPLEEGLVKHRGNRGRLLVYIDLPGMGDYQELMIREGLSPYFTKYGYAHFADRHEKYALAEQAAQAARRGVWDQIGNNGREMRDYTALTAWWELRARIIQDFRDLRAHASELPVYEASLDYERLIEIANARGEATVFLELRDFKAIEGGHVVFFAGGRARPFRLFLPDATEGEGRDAMTLIATRYMASGEQRPRRSFAYVTGPLQMHDRRPEIVVTRAEQISDWAHIGQEFRSRLGMA